MGGGHMDAQTPQPRIALIDGNSFYCSCEQVMRPAFEGRPLVVLSNNDGCAIARTSEAKALGIKMGAPWFQIQSLTHSHGLIALSANFALYGDFSQRMMNVIGQFSPRQDIYSIDESFLDLTGVSGSGDELGQAIRQRVLKWVGLPTCVGIGPSRTLAKLANHLAKTHRHFNGVCDLSALSAKDRLALLHDVPLKEVWGIGRRLLPQLQALQLHTAADLALADPRVLRDRFSIVLSKTAQELAGVSCLEWEDFPSPKQQIMCSRSFGQTIRTQEDLAQALATFTAMAAAKLRQQTSTTRAVFVFARTSFFRNDPSYAGSTTHYLPYATSHTSTLTQAVWAALARIYKPGFNYVKAGVCLLELEANTAPTQASLFEEPCPTYQDRSHTLMQVMDQLNQRFGQNTLSLATHMHPESAPWRMKQQRKTPAYTTNWADIVEVGP